MNMQPSEEKLQQFRPVPFYFITTTDPRELSYEAVYTSLSELKEEGFGGLVLFNKPPHGFSAEEYLTDAWFDMVRNFAKASRKLNLRLWINDGFDFPPGSVGGRINKEKYPQLTPKRLVLREGTVLEEEVDWGFPAFEEPESAELFHKYVYEAYYREVGEYFGTPICGFFSDADNRRVNFMVYPEESPQRNYFPWCDGFASSFEKIYGYDITPYLLKILSKESCLEARDYWEHAGRLYQSWFASNYKWCKEHGLEYTFHTSDSAPFQWEEAPRCSAYTEGRALDMESNSDYPGTDQELLEVNGGKHMRQQEYWLPKVSWGGDTKYIRNPKYYSVYSDLRAKQAGSTAFLYHKKGAMCEMFAASNWGATPTDLREIATWQIMQGITFIVPHAYHHRLLGETKYFAPPVFSPHSNMKYYAKELNDTLARNCYFASLGRLIAPIAVLDITDDIWEGRTKSNTLFEVCEKLNRMPYGYVLADVKSIIANKEEFSVIINTGAPLQGKRAEQLQELNIPIIYPDELEQLPDYVDCKVSYEGDGTPHFMRRRLKDGTELVLLANVEDGKVLHGTLQFAENRFPVILQSGELLFFTEKEQLVKDDIPEAKKERIRFPDEVPVVWEQENILPLEYWINQEGKTVAKHHEVGRISTSYSVVEEGIQDLKLYISARHMQSVGGIFLDGCALTQAAEVSVLDDAYYSYELGAGAVCGEHEIVLNTTSLLCETDRIFLQGEFGVEIKCEDAYKFLSSGAQYSLAKYLPHKTEVTLNARTKVLNMSESWCGQGHPFYSGRVSYYLSLEEMDKEGTGVIHIPKVSDGCILKVDGERIGQRCFEPYNFVIKNMQEKHELEITVYNSMGNAMEFYQAPSGITAGVYLTYEENKNL